MLSAKLTVKGAAAKSVVPAIGPEAGRELPRTEITVDYDGDDAVITIRASDSSAMRAALNSYLECIRIIEDVDNLTKARI